MGKEEPVLKYPSIRSIRLPKYLCGLQNIQVNIYSRIGILKKINRPSLGSFYLSPFRRFFDRINLYDKSSNL
jgi:hypothetical protein